MNLYGYIYLPILAVCSDDKSDPMLDCADYISMFDCVSVSLYLAEDRGGHEGERRMLVTILDTRGTSIPYDDDNLT